MVFNLTLEVKKKNLLPNNKRSIFNQFQKIYLGDPSYYKTYEKD